MGWWAAAGLATGVAAALAVFGAPFTALLAAVGAGALVSRWRWVAVIPWVVAGPVALGEYPRRIEPLAARHAKGGAAALSVRDLASVWVLHLGVAAGGAAAGFPEVACETAGLLVPGAETWVFRSSFPAGAAEVRAVVERWEGVLRSSTSDAVMLRPKRVPIARTGQWREALALDPITLSGSAVRQPGGWRLTVVGRVPVDYPPHAAVPLFGTPLGPIRIHEGLFDALEERGWLFPYTAEWRWSTWVAD